MKTLLIALSVMLNLNAFANDNMLLIDEQTNELVIVNEAQESLADNPDRTLLDNDFSLASALKDIIVVDAQVVATVMVFGGRANVGLTALNRYLEFGLDAELLFIAAGTRGAVNPNLGSYVKVRLTPHKAKTVYFKGRVMKAFNLSDDIDDIMPEFGVGYERGSSFFEASVRLYHDKTDGSTFAMPFVSFGMRIQPKAKEETRLFR